MFAPQKTVSEKCAEKELDNFEIFKFPNWDNIIELDAYKSDSEIIKIVFDGIETSGNVIIENMNLDKPVELEFKTLAEEIDKLPVMLKPHDMIFIWKDKPIITVVGHFGIYAHIK